MIVDADYHKVLDFHKKNHHEVTVVGAVQRHVVPYGVIELSKKGTICEMREKPVFDFTINTGVYVFQKNATKAIPNRLYDMNDLVSSLIKKGKRVGVYPVSDTSYADLGQWEEYQKNMGLLLGKPSSESYVPGNMNGKL